MIALIVVLFVILIWVLMSVPRSRAFTGGNDRPLLQLDSSDLAELEDVKKYFESKIQQPIYEVSQLSKIPYRRSNSIFTGCHAGQRKLLMTEIQFYCNIQANSIVVYSGSASGDHTTAILEMFPSIKLILIDPAYHNIDYDYTVIYQNPAIINPANLAEYKGRLRAKDESVVAHAKRLTVARTLTGDRRDMFEPSDIEMIRFKEDHANFGQTIRDGDCRVYIIQDYLTPDLADILEQCSLGDICYVSDIRSTMLDSHPTDADYIWNDALQLYLIKKLRPLFSMLKFHPPYFNGDNVKKLSDPVERSKNNILQMMYDDIEKVKAFGLDMLENYSKGEHYYLNNIKIYLQSWAPVNSSETRLIASRENIDQPYINYDHEDWDNKFFYLRFMRSFGYFDMFYKYVKHHRNNPYDGCFDCMLEMFILGKYLSKDTDWDMDPVKIAQFISKNVDKLIELSQLVENNMLFPSTRSVKCGIHDQITQPLKGIFMFKGHEGNLYKASVASKTAQQVPIEQRYLNIAGNTKASKLAQATLKRFAMRKDHE
jgi:hypothetical protein